MRTSVGHKAMIDNLPPACQETRTWFNRNGTFLRVLIVVDEHSHIPRSLGDVDVNVQRLIVVSAGGADQLNASTERLNLAAATRNIELVSADGHHRCIVERIAAANNTRHRT